MEERYTNKDLMSFLNTHQTTNFLDPKGFSGKKNESSRDLLLSFDDFCAYNSIVHNDNVLLLENYLYDDAKRWFQTLSSSMKAYFDLIFQMYVWFNWF